MFRAWTCVVVALLGCDGMPAAPAVGDAALADGQPLLDAAAPSGFGDIAGPCGQLSAEINTNTSSLFHIRLDFGTDPFDNPDDTPALTDGGRQLLDEGTAGGSSIVSELFAYEVLARCENASLLKTETSIEYDPPSSKLTDMLVDISGSKIGVSVTRAFVFPTTDPYTTDLASALLESKLADVLDSSANVVPADEWNKQILAVLAYGDMHAASIDTAWHALSTNLRADTIVYVVTTDGMDEPLY